MLGWSSQEASHFMLGTLMQRSDSPSPKLIGSQCCACDAVQVHYLVRTPQESSFSLSSETVGSRVQVYTDVCTHASQAHMHIHMHRRTCVHICTCTCTLTHIHMHTRTCVHICTCTRTRMHTLCIHTCTHTTVHTCTHSSLSPPVSYPPCLVRISSTRLLLWPCFRLSPPALLSSPLLRQLVFTSHTHSGYAHITHSVYPLQTFAHTSAELGRISSTVTSEQDGGEGEGQGEGPVAQTPPEAAPMSEYMHWTEIPAFLFTYTPKVCTHSTALALALALVLALPLATSPSICTGQRF